MRPPNLQSQYVMTTRRLSALTLSGPTPAVVGRLSASVAWSGRSGVAAAAVDRCGVHGPSRSTGELSTCTASGPFHQDWAEMVARCRRLVDTCLLTPTPPRRPACHSAPRSWQLVTIATRIWGSSASTVRHCLSPSCHRLFTVSNHGGPQCCCCSDRYYPRGCLPR